MKTVGIIFNIPFLIISALIMIFILLVIHFKETFEAVKDRGIDLKSIDLFFQTNYPILIKILFPPEYISIPISLSIWFWLFH